jgi:hypothetical protein
MSQQKRCEKNAHTKTNTLDGIQNFENYQKNGFFENVPIGLIVFVLFIPIAVFQFRSDFRLAFISGKKQIYFETSILRKKNTCSDLHKHFFSTSF